MCVSYCFLWAVLGRPWCQEIDIVPPGLLEARDAVVVIEDDAEETTKAAKGAKSKAKVRGSVVYSVCPPCSGVGPGGCAVRTQFGVLLLRAPRGCRAAPSAVVTPVRQRTCRRRRCCAATR